MDARRSALEFEGKGVSRLRVGGGGADGQKLCGEVGLEQGATGEVQDGCKISLAEQKGLSRVPK